MGAPISTFQLLLDITQGKLGCHYTLTAGKQYRNYAQGFRQDWRVSTAAQSMEAHHPEGVVKNNRDVCVEQLVEG